MLVLTFLILSFNHTKNTDTIKLKMRSLWSEHVWWTREYLLSAVQKTLNITAVANRLMKNQEDIGQAFGAYYGKDIGDGLTSLLKTHISIATDIVNKLNSPTLSDITTKWKSNARDIANFISKSTKQNSESLYTMMLHHLDLTTNELMSIKNIDYVKSVVNFDDVLHEAYEMADELTEGIVNTNKWIVYTSLKLPCCK